LNRRPDHSDPEWWNNSHRLGCWVSGDVTTDSDLRTDETDWDAGIAAANAWEEMKRQGFA